MPKASYPVAPFLGSLSANTTGRAFQMNSGNPALRSPPVEPYLKWSSMLAYVTGRSGRKRRASRAPASRGTPTTMASSVQKRHRHGSSIGRFIRSPFELEREVEQLLGVPVDRPEIGVRRNLPDLVADVLGHQRRLRIVEDDAVLLVDEALAEVDLGQDRLEAERPDVIDQGLALGVEDLALPGEVIDEL